MSSSNNSSQSSVGSVSYASIGGIHFTPTTIVSGTVTGDSSIPKYSSTLGVAAGMHFTDTASPDVFFYEYQDGKKVKATFDPEGGMTANELARVTQLMFVMRERPTFCRPVSFIRKHNLERHFRFEEE